MTPEELQNEIETLKRDFEREIEDIRYLLNKKTGGGSNDIRGRIVAPSSVAAAILAAGSVNLAALATIISPTRVVKVSGTVTWSGGGTTLAASISGVLSTDIIEATIQTKPTQAAYLVRATPAADQITFELSNANTSNDCVIAYAAFRATS